MASIDNGRLVTPSNTALPQSGLGKIAHGWKETIEDIPTAIKDTLVKTGHNILHPIDYVKEQIDTIKQDPAAFFKRLAVTAGSIGISFVSPPLGAMIGAAMTASMVAVPTYQFATAKTEEQIQTVAHGAADQLVSYAANRAIGYGMKKAVDAIKAQGSSGIGVTHAKRAKEPIVRNKEIDTEKFSQMRNTADQVRADIRNQYAEALKKQQPNISAADLEAVLNDKGTRKMILDETFRTLNAYSVKAMGGDINLAGQLELSDLRQVRRYAARLDSPYDMADAFKSINKAMEKGVKSGEALALGAEQSISLERGMSKNEFASMTKANLKAKDIQEVRTFSDRLATSQGGKYFKQAAKQAGRVGGVSEMKQSIAGSVMTDMGFQNIDGLNTPTRVAMIQDMGMEEITSNQTYIQNANKMLKEGVNDYYSIHKGFEQTLLGQMGVSESTLKQLSQNWEKDANPAQVNRLYREVRNTLRVLPDDARQTAIGMLSENQAPQEFGMKLNGLLTQQITEKVGDKAIAQTLLGSTKSSMERANLLSTLSRLPDDVKQQVFTGLDSTQAMDKQIVDRFQGIIEDRFNVKMNRTVGAIAGQEDATVVDWDPHGSIQLFNGLNKVAVNNNLPDALKGTTYFRTTGDYGTYGYQFASQGKDYVTITDFSLAAANTDEGLGLTSGEGTIVHESAHAMQLGGPNQGWTAKKETQLDAKTMQDWSKLSNWRESNRSLADGKTRSQFGDYLQAYKDPSFQVSQRGTVMSDYGATDPAEDFAEFARYFYSEPATALKTSPEKYLFLNNFVGGKYSGQQAMAHAQMAGLGPQVIQQAVDALRKKFDLTMSVN